MEDASFIAEYLIDPELLKLEPGPKALDVTNHAIEILAKATFLPEFRKLKESDIKKLVYSNGSQIGNKESYLFHVINTGHIYETLVGNLMERHENIRLPVPEVARSMGFIHDLNATYSDYEKTWQQSKQADLYFHAKHLGVKLVEEHIAMHCCYLETLQVIHDNKPFPKYEAYSTMRNVLGGDGPNSLFSIKSSFNGFMNGMDNLALIVLTVADYLDNGKPFELSNFESAFEEKYRDVKYRYYDSFVEKDSVPSALGRGIVEYKGYKRLYKYKIIVSDLLFGNGERLEPYTHIPSFWCPHF